MIITITAVKLRHWWYFFKLSWHGFKITMQLRKTPGFIKMKNTGFGWWHYTITSWESEAAMQKAMQEGAHKAAMPEIAVLATEFRSYTYQAAHFPSWKEAKEKVKQGRLITY